MAADIATTLNAWSSTSSSNQPDTSDPVGPNTLAQNLQVIQSVMRAASAGDGTIASATTTDLSTVNDGDITVSGTTTITGFGTLTAGIKKVLTFSGALTLTHNATSLILPGAANITTAAGDVAIMRSLGSGNWKCISFTRAASLPTTSADIQVQLATAFTTGGTATAFTLTPTPAITAYVANQEWDVSFSAACGAAPTFQVSGLATPPNLVKQNADGTYSTLSYGDFPSGWQSKVKMVSATQALVRSLPSASSIQGAFKNLQASSTGLNANVSVTADEITVESSTNAYQTLRSVSLTIAGTSVGANALDTGTIAASTWYSIWVIWSGTTTAGLLSLSATAPTMPSGYTHKARVGWIRTDGTANKYPLSFKQYGRNIQYVVTAGTNLTAIPVMASGTAGSTSTPTWVAVAIGTFVPTTASRIIGVVVSSNTNGTAMVAPNNAYGAMNSITNPPPAGAAAAGSGGASVTFGFNLESTNIYWAAITASGAVACLGWEDNL